MRPAISLLAQPHGSTAERIEWSIEDQAFSRSFDSAPRRPPSPPPPTVSKLSLFLRLLVSCCRSSLHGGEGRGERGSRIILPQVSLNLYKSFNPLWSTVSQKAMAPKSTEWDLPKANSGIFCDPKKYSIRTLFKHFLRFVGVSLRFVNWSVQYWTLYTVQCCPIQLCRVAEKALFKIK